MMLTSLECERNGLTFASVHDCYWTHACDVNQMNLFCRKQFVSIHKEPLLDVLGLSLCNLMENYHHYNFVSRHDEHLKLVSQHIPLGDFDLDKVLDSEFFFS